MSELKMSDVFELPLKPIDYQNGIVDSNGFGVIFSDFLEYEKKALCDAVNSHDRLVEETQRLTAIATKHAVRADELYEAIEAAMRIKDLWLPNGSFSDNPPENYAEMEALAIMAKNFELLLDKSRKEAKE